MSLNAATIEILIAKGLSAADILDVARATEVKKDATNAERQARHRAKKSGKRNAVTVTPDPSPNDIYSNPQPVPLDISNEISPQTAEKPNGEGLKPEHVVEAWNATAERLGLPKGRLTDDRRRKLRSMIRKHPIEDFTEAIQAIERSPFCRGENSRGWRADLDFLLQPKSFTRLIEGSYDGSN